MVDIAVTMELGQFDSTVTTQPSESCFLITENELIESEKNLFDQFKQLLKLYSMHVNDKNERLCYGGMQQYLNHQQKVIQERKRTCSRNESENDPENHTCIGFNSLPVNVQLKIFSYLEAKDLCKVSYVCSDWNILTSDNLLWQEKLTNDVRKWNTIGHMTNPSVYREVDCEWTNKEIYLRCSPEFNKSRRHSNYHFHQLSSLIRSFLPKKVPLVALFGPGLESEGTSGIVRKIVSNKEGPFKVTGMFPGLFDGGYGNAIQVCMNQQHSMKLTILYSSTKDQRENLGAEQRLQINRMLDHRDFEAGTEDDDDDEVAYDLKDGMKDLCRAVDAFVFVVDGQENNKTLHLDKSWLFAMVNERWSSSNIPVLILSCVKDTSVKRLPCIDVVNRLHLGKLSKPWQVINCDVESMEGITDGIEWVIEKGNRR